MESFYFYTTLITISVIGLTSIAGGLTLKLIKKFELRLFDEKRAKIKLNDYIIFKSLSESSKTLKVKVLGLLHYNSFEDLFNDVDYNLCGPADSLNTKLERLHNIYPINEEVKYGILAIRIEPI